MAAEQRLIYINEVEEMVGSFADQAYTKEAYAAFWKVIHNIRQMPTIEARPVVHGRWLFVTKGQHTSVYVCSECNRAVTVVCDEDIREEKLAKDYPYCHCGADMRGIQND